MAETTVSYADILVFLQQGQLDSQVGRDEVYVTLGNTEYEFQSYDLRNAKAATDKGERITLKPARRGKL